MWIKSKSGECSMLSQDQVQSHFPTMHLPFNLSFGAHCICHREIERLPSALIIKIFPEPTQLLFGPRQRHLDLSGVHAIEVAFAHWLHLTQGKILMCLQTMFPAQRLSERFSCYMLWCCGYQARHRHAYLQSVWEPVLTHDRLLSRGET